MLSSTFEGKSMVNEGKYKENAEKISLVFVPNFNKKETFSIKKMDESEEISEELVLI